MTSLGIPDEPYGLDLLGISIHTAPLNVLERLALGADEVAEVYRRLVGTGLVKDALVVSTCNRTEIYTSSDVAKDTSDDVVEVLRGVTGDPRFPGSEHLFRLSGRAGVKHLYEVSCGLDSMILGEAQILGQLRASYERSQQFFKPSSYFDRLVQGAFRVAARSRAETDIGVGATSVASAGVHLTSRIFSDFHRLKVVIVGAGETGRLVAEHFLKQRPAELVILNRTHERARALAVELGCESRPLEELEAVLESADIVATAVSTPKPVITSGMVQQVMHDRGAHTLAILDLGLPRNVHSSVNDLLNVFVYDIEALRWVVNTNLGRRADEVPQVQELIENELEKLLDWQRSVRAGPLIVALRDSVDQLRRAEVQNACKGLTEVEVAAVERATRAITNKLLHGPMTTIRAHAKRAEEGAETLDIIKGMFSHLQGDPDDKDSD